MSVLECYKGDTQKIIRRFLDHQIEFRDCISALEAKFAGLLHRLKPEHLPTLRAMVLANNETVMQEMERRKRIRKINPKSHAGLSLRGGQASWESLGTRSTQTHAKVLGKRSDTA